GLSVQNLPWDKIGGSRDIRSRPLPSTYARWSEYRRLARQLRERDRVFQGVPNVTTKLNIFLFLMMSVGILGKALKTTVISMMDTRANRGLHVLAGVLSRIFNRVLGASFRWQALPEPFDLWADGIDLVVFEEFGAGAAALHLQDPEARARLLADPAYRKAFRRQWRSKLLPKVFHRDFNRSVILRAPDPALVGKSFAELGRARGQDAVDTFLDLVIEHGEALRWYTVMANDRPRALEEIVSHPDVLIGFSDAGAHLRNMAHYNFPLRLLRLVHEAERRGQPFMTVGRAVHRLTGEIGAWLGLDVGTVEVGKHADLVVIDPCLLGEVLDGAVESPMLAFGGMMRMVNENGGAVTSVVIRGREAVRGALPVEELGRERGFGRVLRAGPSVLLAAPQAHGDEGDSDEERVETRGAHEARVDAGIEEDPRDGRVAERGEEPRILGSDATCGGEHVGLGHGADRADDRKGRGQRGEGLHAPVDVVELP
ncbi:MAG: hypothetical protein ABIP89_04170, partial [Polyangiaceae bacterium]